MPREIDVVGVWNGVSYRLASVSSSANMVFVVPAGSEGRHTAYPGSGHRHSKNPTSGESTWYPRQVPLSAITLEQPLDVIRFTAAGPPASAKPYVSRPSRDSFTFEAHGDGEVKLALVGSAEASDALVTVTAEPGAAAQLFSQYAPNVLIWVMG